MPDRYDATNLLDGTATVKGLVERQIRSSLIAGGNDVSNVTPDRYIGRLAYLHSPDFGWSYLPSAIRCREFARWLRELADAVFTEPEEED